MIRSWIDDFVEKNPEIVDKKVLGKSLFPR